jgi:hypothetical protein
MVFFISDENSENESFLENRTDESLKDPKKNKYV